MIMMMIKSTLEIFSFPSLKYGVQKKPQFYVNLSKNGRQSEARNFETAQHIDKRLSFHLG